MGVGKREYLVGKLDDFIVLEVDMFFFLRAEQLDTSVEKYCTKYI